MQNSLVAAPKLKILLLILLLFFLEFLNLLPLNGTYQAAAWIKHQHYRWLQAVTVPVEQLRQFWKLRNQLEDLQYRYSEAAAELGRLRQLEEENTALTAMLADEQLRRETVTITAPITSFAQTFVAAGSDSGVREGAAVLANGSLLGLVESVSATQARVLLLTNMLEGGIVAETATGVRGLIKGNGRDALLTEVESTADLTRGELVYTVGQMGVPRGLLLGRIAQLIEQNPSQATRTARLEQLVNFYELSLVEIR